MKPVTMEYVGVGRLNPAKEMHYFRFVTLFSISADNVRISIVI